MTDRVLMIEDDRSLAAMLREYLGSAGIEIAARATAREGLAELRRAPFDAVILDLMLPDLDGLEVCRQVRAESDVPILMLTARGDDADRIVGLELGADDYLPKPFNPRELLARLRAILRRRGPRRPVAALRFGRLEIDLEARQATVDGVPRPLTAYQFDLLSALAHNAGRVMSRDTLLSRVRDLSREGAATHGGAEEPFDRSIDVHVSRLRAALEDDPRHPRRILTVRGVGYVFAARQDQESVR